MARDPMLDDAGRPCPGHVWTGHKDPDTADGPGEHLSYCAVCGQAEPGSDEFDVIPQIVLRSHQEHMPGTALRRFDKYHYVAHDPAANRTGVFGGHVVAVFRKLLTDEELRIFTADPFAVARHGPVTARPWWRVLISSVKSMLAR